MTDVASGSAAALVHARAAVDGAQHEPHSALRAARELLLLPALDAETVATAQWAVGLASRELNDLAAADTHLEAAATTAGGAGLLSLAGRIRTSRALVLAYLGRADEGLAELDAVAPHLDEAGRARALMQRCLILQRMGRLDEAIRGFAQALPGIEAAGDRLAVVRLLVNRGIALTYRNRLIEADADLVAARDLALELGQSMQVAACSHNLGFLHGRRGDVPRSLEWFDRADAEYSTLGVERGLKAVLLADRAEVLLDAGLGTEAVTAAQEAARLLSTSGNRIQVAEASLMLARTALAVGDRSSAQSQAATAFDAFTDQHRAAWATLARYIMLTASPTDRASALDPEDIVALADELAESGWSLEAVTARIIAGRHALTTGDPATAQRLLTSASQSRKTSGGAVFRAGGWYAEALRRQAAGEPGKARRAARTGLRLLDEHRATFGAADLRAHAAAHGERLADLLVSIAVESGKPAALLTAAESWRAGGLSVAARPPENPLVAEKLSALRARAGLRRSGQVPEPDRETARLEQEIRDLMRGQRAAGAADESHPGRPFDRRSVADQLGDRLLVEWVTHNGRLLVVWMLDGRTARSDVGPLSAVLPAIHAVRMCLHRLAWGGGSARSIAGAGRALVEAAGFLEKTLLGPVPQVGDRGLVLVPTGALHRIPWSTLPTVRRAASAVAPSARSWQAAAVAPRPSIELLLVAGPDLPGASAEIAEIAGIASTVPPPTVLDAGDATVERVLEQLGTATVAHLAAHGRFRTDNPQFSSLALADGDLTVYDLEALPRVPHTLVIAACDTATSDVRPGDELLGLSAALLSLGASSVVAPSVPVSDTATIEVMVSLQRRLLRGEPADAALSGAIADVSDVDDPQQAAVAQSFVVLGS